MTIVDDPTYLEEPFIRTTNWVLNPDQEVRRTQFDVVDEVAERVKGRGAALPSGISGCDTQADRVRVQVQAACGAARGGAATTYPEFDGVDDAASNRRGPEAGLRGRPACTSQITRHLQTVHVQGKVYMMVGAGGNIIVQAGEEGVLVIDTGQEPRGADVLAAIRKISDKPIRIVINTHVHADHTGANEAIAAAGRALGGNAPGNSGLALETRESWHTRTSSSE